MTMTTVTLWIDSGDIEVRVAEDTVFSGPGAVEDAVEKAVARAYKALGVPVPTVGEIRQRTRLSEEESK